ncbi:cell surface protein [Clostridium sp. AWRP]|uniref:cell surface protein n=1 Tax=Clostridium sp. AWRP TaxID=2212991 RepID=UPI000FDB9597|nr:cell surface protein [Clostridium sp. AWRP]AZV57193.1 cell surface protein [Clostridium sp. AWRP]
MKKLWKKMNLVIVLLFTLTIFAPYSALAADVTTSTPSLIQNTEENYTISSVEDLNKFREDIDNGVNYLGKKVILTQDIDIAKSDVPLKSFTTNKGFDGTFDGKFYTISNYTDSKSGLFGIVDKDGIVENVRIDANVTTKNSTIKANGSSNYGLIANEAGGTIACCSSTGTITDTTTDVFVIAGIVGNDDLYRLVGGKNVDTPGTLKDCYSNVTFDNEVKNEEYSVVRSGICRQSGEKIDHCYFYGKFIGNDGGYTGDGCPIVSDTYYNMNTKVTTMPENCAYDKDILGTKFFCANDSKGYTTEEMKNKDTYTKLGFDFDKTWKIDSSINGGYPYLNSENTGTDKVATKIPVDIQVTAEDRTYDPAKSSDENIKTKIDSIKVIAESDENANLISQYDVKAVYSGDAVFNALTIGTVPVSIDVSKLKITYNSNDDYQFILGKVLPASAKLNDDGAPGPTLDQQKKQIEDAKKAEDILYNKLKMAQGDVPEFTWSGNKAAVPGVEGTIELNDYVWEVFSSARSGYTGVRKGFYDDWFKSIQTGLQKMKDAGITPGDVKMTEWEKLVLAITAIGYDARDIKAYDLIDIISNKDYLKVSPEYFTPQYDIYALTSYNYINSIPKDGKHITSEDIDKEIHDWAKNALGTKGADGSEVVSNAVSDMWTMQSQPIAAYYNPDAKEGDKYYDVKQAMDHVFAQFSNAQSYRGSFWGGFKNNGIPDYNNAWTNAQVYMTLGMANQNIFDKRYVKCGKTVLDGVLEKFDLEKGTTVFDNSSYEPAQICRGLDSLIRTAEGRNSIFDCTDVKNSTVPVNNAVAALPDVDKLTSTDKDKVDGVEKLYDALSDAQKSSMKQETVDKLTASEKKVSGSQDETKSIKITNMTKDSSFKLDNDAKVSVKAENNSGKEQDASLIVALYDGSNKFINYVCGKQTIKNGDSSILTGIIKLPEKGIYKLKAFVWDSIEEMNSLSDVIDIPVESNK